MRLSLLFLLFCLLPLATIQAQDTPATTSAISYLQRQAPHWKLTPADLQQMQLRRQYTSKASGTQHFYFKQRHAGIEVHQAITGVHLNADGAVAHATNRFIADLAHQVNIEQPALTAKEALVTATSLIGAPLSPTARVVAEAESHHWRVEGDGFAKSPILIELNYLPMGVHFLADGQMKSLEKVQLAWRLRIDLSNHYWELFIDAENGQLLQQRDMILRCRMGEPHHHTAHCYPERSRRAHPHPGLGRPRPSHSHSHPGLGDSHPSIHPERSRRAHSHPGLGRPRPSHSYSEHLIHPTHTPILSPPPAPTNDGAQYRVWSHLIESPLYGDRTLIVDPADDIASPYGWHDTDGVAGAEYTITRGNNVHAYLDLLDDDVSLEDEPDGGAELIFDFPFADTLEPADYQEASVTQLFYMNNFMHDFSYAYGFDEVAGNFQQNNYGQGGEDGDPVMAESQNGPETNEANFTVLPDGFMARMQMFRWDIQGGRLITIESPAAIAGAYESGTALFGPPLTATPISGTVVAAYDNAPSGANRLCGEAANPDEINGNVAMVDRGVCPFQQKTVNAEAAGAIAVIICNYEEQANILGDNSSVAEPNIPTISMKFSDCQKIRDLMSEGVQVRLQLPDNEGPTYRDGALDNGVIAHEYTHGISVRLTGGADDEACLFNDEQMGEGWSDFFSLVTGVTAADVGSTPRGIGNYISGGNVESSGIRRRPYSTDPAINDYTYGDIIGTNGPHAVGEVWASMLWDIYWAMVEEHGFDEDLLHGDQGNNMAVQLVMDGMKLQACSPGFIDGRDAILKADTLLYGGANACLLWNVFAQRGLGWRADQGSNDDRHDLKEDFEPFPACTPTLKIAKEVTDYIEPGDPITVTLNIRNDQGETATGLEIVDQLVNGLMPVLASVEGANEANINGTTLVLELPDMPAGTQHQVTYQLETDPTLGSQRQFFDDMEDGDDNWLFENLIGIEVWDRSTANPFSETWSWYVENSGLENDQALYLVEPFSIEGDFPVVRFMHDYDTESGEDGGLIEFSTDGLAWQPLEDRLFGERYQGPLAYSTFAIPNLQVFMGDSEGYVASYIDLRDFVGQDIYLRWRYGTDEENNEFDPNTGWFVDDVEYMDLFYYQTEACISSAAGETACSTPSDWGTKVSSDIMTSTEDVASLMSPMKLYPNPAQSEVWIQMNQATPPSGALVKLLSPDGRTIREMAFGTTLPGDALRFSLSKVPTGMYFVEVQLEGRVLVEKLVVR